MFCKYVLGMIIVLLFYLRKQASMDELETQPMDMEFPEFNLGSA